MRLLTASRARDEGYTIAKPGNLVLAAVAAYAARSFRVVECEEVTGVGDDKATASVSECRTIDESRLNSVEATPDGCQDGEQSYDRPDASSPDLRPDK